MALIVKSFMVGDQYTINFRKFTLSLLGHLMLKSVNPIHLLQLVNLNLSTVTKESH